MGSSVTVNVELSPNFEEVIANLPQVKGALTEEANAIAARANGMSAGFRTGLYHHDHKSPAVGNTQPRYEAEAAHQFGRSSVALVHPANYAAMKDTHLHNTLLKSI